MFARVPAIDGVPQIGTRHLKESKSINDREAIAFFDGDMDSEWLPLMDLEYLAYWQAGRATVDKNIITADGVDAATITVEVASGVETVTFYYVDTGEVLSTVPVDPITHTATLQVTATTPGIIRIRAGEPTITKLNEVVINAT